MEAFFCGEILFGLSAAFANGFLADGADYAEMAQSFE
jgi:hypothetical protein